MGRQKIIRITTTAVSMRIILRGQLRYMNRFYDIVGVTSRDKSHFDKISSQEGIHIIEVPMLRSIHPFRDIQSLWKMVRVLRTERPDIVHTHTPKAGLTGMLSAWMTGVPHRIHTVGGMPMMEMKGIKKYIVRLTEKITYACAQHVWPNSRGLMQYIIDENLCRPSKLKVIGHGASNGVDTQRFDPDDEKVRLEGRRIRSELGFSQEDIIIIFVGRFAREKGIMELYQAVDTLTRDNKNIHLVLLGVFENDHGSLSADEQELIKRHPNIHHPGRADDVRPYLSMSDIFVLPSYREGFPNALMEAAAMAMPCIATDINGCNELIEHDVNGWLVPVKDDESLRQALSLLINNKEKREQLGSKARRTMISQFDNHIVWEAMHEAYRQILKERNK